VPEPDAEHAGMASTVKITLADARRFKGTGKRQARVRDRRRLSFNIGGG
jgi:hypothetical protein